MRAIRSVSVAIEVTSLFSACRRRQDGGNLYADFRYGTDYTTRVEEGEGGLGTAVFSSRFLVSSEVRGGRQGNCGCLNCDFMGFGRLSVMGGGGVGGMAGGRLGDAGV